jgi:hypothetical protein
MRSPPSLGKTYRVPGQPLRLSFVWSLFWPTEEKAMRMMASMVVLVTAVSLSGCGGTSLTPTAPTQPIIRDVSPSVAAVSPETGSTGGGTRLKITGTGFLPGATVAFGGAPVQARFDSRDHDGTVMYVETPPHDPGTVDVVVTNSGGQPGKLAGGYTYAPPEAFDFNGTWTGFGNAGEDIPLGFTIENNLLVSAWCDTLVLTLPVPSSVNRGEFSVLTSDGIGISGRIVAASLAVGTMNFGPCAATIFGVTKR